MIIKNFTQYILPFAVGIIVIFGLIKKIHIFDAFLFGAKDGLKATISIVPSLIGLITAISMLKASGALDLLAYAVAPITNALGVPNEIIPLLFLRPISGSGSLAFVDSIIKGCGPDSFAGRVASVVMGSTETTFYAIAVYFGAIGIKNTKHTIPAALLADLTGFIASVLMVKIFFYL